MIIVWPDQGGSWQWCDSDNQRNIRDGLPELEACVLIPTEKVFLNEIELPKTRQPQKIIPFAIEEDLIEAPDFVHISYAPLDAKNKYAVAAINRDSIADYKAQLAESQTDVSAMLPDVLALRWHAGEWTVVCLDDRCLIRYGEYAGIAVSFENAAFVFDKIIMQNGTPDACAVYNCPQVVIDYLESKAISFSELDNYFSDDLIQSCSLNLAGKSKTKKKKSPDGSRTLWLTSFLILVALLIFIGNAVADKVISGKIAARFSQNMQVISSKLGPKAAQDFQDDPVGTLQSVLTNVQNLRTHNAFLHGVNAIGKVLKKVTHGPVQSLDYNKSYWQLTLAATKNEQIHINSAFANSKFKYQVVKNDDKSISYKLMGPG
jgi:type II secretion system protein L